MSNGITYIQTLLSSVWPNWKITKQLGYGSYGIVYEIVRENQGNQYACALKVLRMEIGGAGIASAAASGYDRSFYAEQERDLDDFENRVRTEIDLMMQLKGIPNIVGIEDYDMVSDEKSRTFLIRMEELESLDKYIKRTKPLQREEIVRMGIDMCTALEHCEEKKILHRDIKPSNIYYTEKAGYKLGDFGISRTLSFLREKMSMTGSIGTILYMAPEVYFGGKYDQTVDIYSLGIVLYIYLNDELPPFCSGSDRDEAGQVSSTVCHEANMRRLIGDMLPAPINADKALAEIVCKACDPNPANRFQSASAFKKALQMYIKNGSEETEEGDGDTGDTGEPESPPRKPSYPMKKILLSAGALLLSVGIMALVRFIYAHLTSGEKEVFYTVFYESAAGELLDQMTYPGTSGETVKIRAPVFDGYTARTNSVSTTLSDKPDDNNIVIIYEAVDNDKTVAYTIISEDSSGVTLAKKARHGIVGQRVTEVADQRDGYTVEEDRQYIVLSEIESSNVIYFIYSKEGPGSTNPGVEGNDDGNNAINSPAPESALPDPSPVPSGGNGINNEIPSTALHYRNHSYYAVSTDTVLSFWQAKSYCESMGGYLAVINDDNENEALYDYVFDALGYQSAYFGLTNDGSDDEWYWADGSEYGYTNWLSGQPDNQNGNEHYALFYYKDTPYMWNDGDFGLDDSGTVTFLIEWDEM